MSDPTPRRRFQFRLRTLMLAVTIVAVICAVCLPALKEWLSQQEPGEMTNPPAPISFSSVRLSPAETARLEEAQDRLLHMRGGNADLRHDAR